MVSNSLKHNLWETVYLNEVCDVNPIYRIKEGELCSFIDMASLSEGSPKPRNIDIREYEKRSGSKFKNGDVLFARITPCTENGKTALVQGLTTEHGFGSTEFIVLSPKGKLDSKFLYYLVKDGKIRNRAIARMVGSTGRQRVPNEFFRDELEITLPPLKEQRKIAAILTSVDDAIEKTEAVINQTEVVKKGLMQRLLTKGIGHTKFKKVEIGEIPDDWSIGTLKEFCEHITKGATPTTYGFNWTETGIRFLRSECVKESGLTFEGANYISEEAHESMKRSVIRGGDLLVSITGNIGRGCIYPERYPEANINQHIARVRVIKSDLLNPNFLLYYINSEPVRRHFYLIKTGQAYPQISLKQVQDLKIPLPTIDEQNKIASILGAFDLRIQTELKTVEQLRQLKNSLMQDLLTGKVRVTVDEASEVSV